MDQRALARKNLEKRLAPLRNLQLAPPPRGWTHALRKALGMTSAQLGKRIGVSQPRAFVLEKAETEGTITLRTLREAAEAMECTLVYALVPRKPLDAVFRDRVALQVDRELSRLNQTMSLENQALSRDALAAERERKIAELTSGSPRGLWDDE